MVESTLNFRSLKASEIECRIGIINEKGLSLLLFKNARCDMNILDETVGVANWQRRHYECKGNLFCEIGIKIDNEWIWKGDCGSESYTDKEKGEASDSFKRSGVNWGIGRELYTAPFIWIKTSATKKFEKQEVNGRVQYKCKDEFRVKHILTRNKIIEQLVIFNETTKQDCFTYGVKKIDNGASDKLLDKDIQRLEKLILNAGSNTADILKYYQVESLEQLNIEQYSNCCEMLARKERNCKAKQK